MEEVLVPIMYDLPDREDIGEVIIAEGGGAEVGCAGAGRGVVRKDGLKPISTWPRTL